MKFRFLGLLTIVSLLASVFAVPYTAPVAAGEEPVSAPYVAPGKLEDVLLDQLAAEGSADYIVQFVEQADLSPAFSMGWDERGWFVYDTLRAVAARSQAGAQAMLDAAGLSYQTFLAGNELYVWDGDLSAAQSLASLNEVEYVRAPQTFYVDPVVEQEPLVEPNALAWGIIDTQADQFWSAFGVKGQGIRVANIDTGVQWDHPALVNQFACPGDPGDAACWRDPSNICPGGTACDNNGHGTHVMGTQAGSDDPLLTWQAGMAPNSTWIACKGCEDNSCSEFALNTCADWIIAPDNDPANRPHVVNNSWGGGGCNTWYLAKVNAWRAAGTFPAFSAGNSGSGCGTLGSPGDYQESFGTAAHASNRDIASFSSRGPSCFGHDPYTKPNISAPGVNICSSVPGDGWSCGYSGTSMSSPHTAGAVALLWSCNPSLIGEMTATFEALQDTADAAPAGNCGAPPDSEGNYTYGYGYLNVYAAGLLFCGDIGYLEGHVYDADTGNPIEGATVSAAPSGVLAAGSDVTTDPTGYYTMTLAVGTYDVTASHSLYTPAVATNVEIRAGLATTQDFALEPRGMLWGYVTDFDNGFPLDATVAADDGTSADTDPATGYYELFLDEGTYDVTASAQDYAPYTETVAIVSGQDTQQDFSLLAAVALIPSPVHITLDWQTTGTLSATLHNRLPDPYPFEFLEGKAGFMPLMAEGEEVTGQGEWLYRATTGVPMLNNRGEEELAYPSAYRWTAHSPSQVSVLIYADDYYHPAPNTFLDRALQALGMSYTAHYNGGFSGFLSSLQSGTWDLVLVGNDYYGDTSIFGPLNDYVLAGGKLIINTWTMSWAAGSPLWSTLGVTWISDDYDPPDPTYWWDPSHPVFTDPESVPEFTQLQGWRYGTYGQHVNWADGFEALAGYTTSGPDPNHAALVLGNDGRTIFKGFLDGQNDADLDSDGTYDGVELWINMIVGLETGFSADVPWFGQEPITGTVPAESSLAVTLLFTATYDVGVHQPGHYHATLKVAGAPRLDVPVKMTVLPPDDMGQLHGYVLDNCTGEPVEAHIEIAGGDPITHTMSDKDTGYYSVWLYAGEYDLTLSAADYLDYEDTATVVAGEAVALDVDLVPDRPCLAVSPDLLEVWVITGTLVYTHPTGIEIINRGGVDLDFEILEIDGVPQANVRLAPKATDLPLATGPAAAPAGASSAEAVVTPAAPRLNQDAILHIYTTETAQSIQRALNELGYAYDLYYSDDWTGIDFGPYDTVIIGMDGGLVSDASLAKIRSDVVDQGKRVIFVGGTCWQPFASAVNQHLVLNNVNDYCWKVSDTPHWTLTDPDHGLADGLPDTYNFANSSAAHYALRATDPDIEVVGVNGDFYHNLFYKNVAFPTAGGNPTQGGDLIWLINSAYENYWTIQADFDLLKQVIENALTYTGAMVDVPWMWQEPITGTVPAGSVLPVDVWFTTVVTDPLPLGTYTATLRVRGNDPVQRTQDVLVRMHIIEDYVAPIPSFTSNSPVMVHEEVVFTNTTIPGIPPETTYLWDFGDGMTSALEHPTHIYHSYGWYTVTLEACNAQLCAEYADMVEILPLEIWLPILLRNF